MQRRCPCNPQSLCPASCSRLSLTRPVVQGRYGKGLALPRRCRFLGEHPSSDTFGVCCQNQGHRGSMLSALTLDPRAISRLYELGYHEGFGRWSRAFVCWTRVHMKSNGIDLAEVEQKNRGMYHRPARGLSNIQSPVGMSALHLRWKDWSKCGRTACSLNFCSPSRMEIAVRTLH
jgi:hypothetical protein